jgi:hypothetical protein
VKDKKKIFFWIAVIAITIVFNALRLVFAPNSSCGGYVFGILTMCACNVITALMYD